MAAAIIILTAALLVESSGHGNQTNNATEKKTPAPPLLDGSGVLAVLFLALIFFCILGCAVRKFRDEMQTKRDLELNARGDDYNAPVRNTVTSNAAVSGPVEIGEAAQRAVREHGYRTSSAPVLIGRTPDVSTESMPLPGTWAWTNSFGQQFEALDEGLHVIEMMQTSTDLVDEPEDTDESVTTSLSSPPDDQESPPEYEEEGMPPEYSEIYEAAPVTQARE